MDILQKQKWFIYFTDLEAESPNCMALGLLRATLAACPHGDDVIVRVHGTAGDFITRQEARK
jgi:hypothetical protein